MMNLERWPKVVALREKLNSKAKAEPGFRFYALYDKLYRKDVLEMAYALCRKNGGAPGVDSQNFEQLEARGVNEFLVGLSHELKTRTYATQAVRRVMIPKPGKVGEFRALGIPTIKDRVVQQAVKLLLEPIFDVDLPANAYGYRPKVSAHDAIEAVVRGLKDGYRDVVDADLSKYFDTIPHDQLLQSVARRIADHKILKLIRNWLKAPVQVEDEQTGKRRIEGGRRTKTGTPQGGVISPLLANIYFRRMLVAWDRLGLQRKLKSRIVNYADDFVILTKGRAGEALSAARKILTAIGLTLNEKKTRICHAPADEFSFLGFTFKTQYSMKGKAYLGFTVSDKKLAQHRERIRSITGNDRTHLAQGEVIEELQKTILGFWNYFSMGTRARALQTMERFTYLRMRRWMKRKNPKGTAWQRKLAHVSNVVDAIFMRAERLKRRYPKSGETAHAVGLA